jgi:hypothetical protein
LDAFEHININITLMPTEKRQQKTPASVIFNSCNTTPKNSSKMLQLENVNFSTDADFTHCTSWFLCAAKPTCRFNGSIVMTPGIFRCTKHPISLLDSRTSCGIHVRQLQFIQWVLQKTCSPNLPWICGDKVRTKLGTARHIGLSVLSKFAHKKGRILVYFSCFIYLEIRKNIPCTNPERITWTQQDIPTTMTMASGTTLLNQNSKFCADHGMIQPHAKYRRRKRVRRRSKKKKSDVWSFCALPGSWGRTRWPKRRPKLDIFGRYFACGRIMPWSDDMQSIGGANGPEAVPKNENDVLPCWALTRRVSAHNGQYITSRQYVSAVTWRVIGAW